MDWNGMDNLVRWLTGSTTGRRKEEKKKNSINQLEHNSDGDTIVCGRCRAQCAHIENGRTTAGSRVDQIKADRVRGINRVISLQWSGFVRLRRSNRRSKWPVEMTQ